MQLEAIKLILTIVSGLAWTIVYIDGIRVGLRDKPYAIPFYALSLNIAWELLYTFLGFRHESSIAMGYRPLRRLRSFSLWRSWGSRPRLYAFVRSANASEHVEQLAPSCLLI